MLVALAAVVSGMRRRAGMLHVVSGSRWSSWMAGTCTSGGCAPATPAPIKANELLRCKGAEGRVEEVVSGRLSAGRQVTVEDRRGCLGVCWSVSLCL